MDFDLGLSGCMNLKQLQYFVRVAELGSFSKAAMVLGIAQPALSRQVRLLETHLRVTLLLRNGRGVELTEMGTRLFVHGVSILQQVQSAMSDIHEARGEPFGRITIGMPPSMSRLLTPALVQAFRANLPNARLSIVEGMSAHLSEWIASGRMDLGLVYNPEPSASLEITPVLKDVLGLISYARQPCLHKSPIEFSSLPKYPLILPERGHAMRTLLEKQTALSGLKLNVIFEVSGIPSILDLVAAGYGNTVLSQTSIAACIKPDAFTLTPFEMPPLSSTLCLAMPSRKPVTPLIGKTRELLSNLLSKHSTAKGQELSCQRA